MDWRRQTDQKQAQQRPVNPDRSQSRRVHRPPVWHPRQPIRTEQAREEQRTRTNLMLRRESVNPSRSGARESRRVARPGLSGPWRATM